MQVVVGVGVGCSPMPQDVAWESLDMAEVLSLAYAETLLGDTQVYRFTGALGGERGEEFYAAAHAFVHSVHTFVFEEEKLLKRETELLHKAGATVVATVAPKAKKKEAFDVFAVANALGSRDRKALWLALAQALRAGAAPEALAGMLHWKVRDMCAKGSKIYTKEELAALSRTLTTLYHEGHRGGGDLALTLEKFALTL